MMNHFKRFLSLMLSIIFLVGCTSPIPSTATPTPLPPPVAGSSGMDDPYYPTLGNGGYDVQAYIIALDVDPTANTLKGSTTITATATERLDSFNLDFHGLTIDSLNVNDQATKYSRNEDELTIDPVEVLELNRSFTVVVDYHGTPGLLSSKPLGAEMGWAHNEDNSINVWGEPDAASVWFPGNNHPRDKATYRFEITVPKPWMVAASGKLTKTKENGDKTLFVWEMDKPMATYLASISIGQYDLFTQSGPHGIAIRNYFPTDFPTMPRIQYNTMPAMIAFFEGLFGPYPFDEYGVVIAGVSPVCNYVGALEAQTMSVHCPNANMSTQRVIAHELAHMWFGDSVSLENWKDIWIKEGTASYAEWLWESKNDPIAMMKIARREQKTFLDNPRYSIAEPSPDDLYTDASYTGGALVLQGLRLEVGDEAFFNIMRTFAQRYQYKNAGTTEFTAIAEEVSSKDLKMFFDTWLFSKTIPKLPE